VAAGARRRLPIAGISRHPRHHGIVIRHHDSTPRRLLEQRHEVDPRREPWDSQRSHAPDAATEVTAWLLAAPPT
jgi:hypothetical protein